MGICLIEWIQVQLMGRQNYFCSWVQIQLSVLFYFCSCIVYVACFQFICGGTFTSIGVEVG